MKPTLEQVLDEMKVAADYGTKYDMLIEPHRLSEWASTLLALTAKPPVCKRCEGRGWIMCSESRDLGGGMGAGGAWNEACPDCSSPASEEQP